jgi:hypothetical protein
MTGTPPYAKREAGILSPDMAGANRPRLRMKDLDRAGHGLNQTTRIPRMAVTHVRQTRTYQQAMTEVSMKKSESKRVGLTARTADKYLLYTDSVQNPQAEVDFLERLYQKSNGHPPRLVREDFCGTAAISCQWIHTHEENRAICVDLDPEPIKWCKDNYLALFPPRTRKRLQFRKADVLNVQTPGVEVILALNFSYCVFKERKVLLKYLQRCRNHLVRGGLMIMDLYGGPEAYEVMEESTRKKGYTYVWDQDEVNPITSEVLNYIHFEFPDGTSIRKAFTYDWRLWTPIELTEAMWEAGFRDARVYWEDADDKGEGNGVYRHRRKVRQETAWVAYIVGQK